MKTIRRKIIIFNYRNKKEIENYFSLFTKEDAIPITLWVLWIALLSIVSIFSFNYLIRFLGM